MKKFMIFFIFIICFCPCVNAEEEVGLTFDENYQKHSINITTTQELALKKDIENVQNYNEKSDEQPHDVESIDNLAPLPQIIVSEQSAPVTFQSKIQNEITKTMKDIYKLQVDNTDSVDPLLKEKLTKYFDRGPFSNLYARAVVQSNFDLIKREGEDAHSKVNVNLINILFDAKTRSGKDMFRVMFDVSPQRNVSFMQNLFKDVFVETTRIPHHSVLIGNSRVGTGMEGLQSPYTLPLMMRSQISRNFSNVRKIGLRVRGDYKYADYDIGVYDSGTYFTDFMQGGEFSTWFNLKPIAKTKGKYGNLKTGLGISTGKRHSTSYFVGGVGVQYSYKNFWTRMEYSAANGSNGSTGLSSKHRQGWYVTLGYKLTKKIELLARYDDFNPDKSVGGNNQREYTTGINYYIKGQALKLVLNYVFCQNRTISNSHRFLIGAQLAI